MIIKQVHGTRTLIKSRILFVCPIKFIKKKREVMWYDKVSIFRNWQMWTFFACSFFDGLKIVIPFSCLSGCSCLVKLLAHQGWLDWSQSCSWSAVHNGWKVMACILVNVASHFLNCWSHLLFPHSNEPLLIVSDSLWIYTEHAISYLSSIYRSDMELLGPNNQNLPKIVHVFAEVKILSGFHIVVPLVFLP